MERITIFTPTYNRAYILPQLYQSLINQTVKDFIWLIIDDGSTDNTSSLVNQWVSENKIKIIYRFQNNAGKMRAHNLAVKICDTDYFCCVDSDDYIVDDSIEAFYKIFDELDDNSKLSGAVFYRGKDETNIITVEFPCNVKETSLFDLYYKGFNGDTTLLYKTAILKEHLFPEIEGEKFITEAVLYNLIDKLGYKLLISKKIIIVTNYLPDGYTHNTIRLRLENPKGWAVYFNQYLSFNVRLYDKIKKSVLYVCYSLLAKNKNILKNANRKFYCFISFPIGYYFYIKYKKQMKALKGN